MRILKFGGKSLNSFEKMQNICKYIKKIYKNDKKIIIIVSAIGSTTDNLTTLANQYGGENLNKHSLATLLSTGETQSSALFSMMLESFNIPAKCVQGHEINLTTFGSKTESLIAHLNKQKLENIINSNTVAVVAGFQGVDKNGEITTLGRGGSDTTAAAIAAVFNTPVEIYSDFDGVFAGDPRKLNFKKLKNIDYDTMIQMAKSGAKVIDERATQIAKNFGIDIISKSSTETNLSGTKISSIENNVISLQSISGLTQITITFSINHDLNFIIKNVFFELKNVKYYNFVIEKQKISFCVFDDDKNNILNSLSKKLKLIK